MPCEPPVSSTVCEKREGERVSFLAKLVVALWKEECAYPAFDMEVVFSAEETHTIGGEEGEEEAEEDGGPDDA